MPLAHAGAVSMALSAAPAVGFIESLQGDLAGTAALQAALCAGAAGGFDGGALFAEDAYRAQPFTDATTVPDATGVTAATDARTATGAMPRPSTVSTGRTAGDQLADFDPGRLTEAAQLSVRWLAASQDLDAVQPLMLGEHRRGSNELVVSGARTTTGKPMLANDPHLALGAPSVFYPILNGAIGQPPRGELRRWGAAGCRSWWFARSRSWLSDGFWDWSVWAPRRMPRHRDRRAVASVDCGASAGRLTAVRT